MKILYSPQVRIENNKIHYQFIGETITAEYNGLINTYDLSELQEDFYKTITNSDNEIINISYIPETVFSFSPIINAYRDNCGILRAELLYFISENASEEEKNPDWFEI